MENLPNNQTSRELVASLFKDESGEPLYLTDGQVEIFNIIFARLNPRNHYITYTQYGKSLTTALALLLRVSTFPEKWAIVAPSDRKAKIIMGYVIQHIFDNDYCSGRFEASVGENREQIRRERSKNRINFKISEGRLGELFIVSAQQKTAQKDPLDALMGFGAANVVIDESSLIDDNKYSGIKRMLGGTKDNFLFEIGNAIRRNHFYRTSRDPEYNRKVINWEQGVAEGRITRDFIREMENEKNFGIMYECIFPDADVIDEGGYSPLLTEKDLDRAYVNDLQFFGQLRMGVDVAGGGKNYSVIAIRGENGARVAYRSRTPDTMSVVGEVLRLKDEYKIEPEHIFIDTVGVGKGVVDRCKEHFEGINGVNVGQQPEYGEDFTNIRSQYAWRLAQWLNGGAKLVRFKDAWEELLTVRYKIQSDRKVKLMSKDDMLKLGIESPDVFDALMLTFSKVIPEHKIKVYKQKAWQPTSRFEGTSVREPEFKEVW